MPKEKLRNKMDERGKRKELSGVVINTKMDKTAKVLVASTKATTTNS